MSYWAVASLALIMALVLVLPFSVKRVEEELEIFLLVMGCAAMTVSGFLDRTTRLRAAIYACYAIGLGAALTPLGEPLSTIVTARLQGAPHNAAFFWLAKLLFIWVGPGLDKMPV